MDSYRGDGLNLYAYVGNNPINYIDPTGHCKEKENRAGTIGRQDIDRIFTGSGGIGGWFNSAGNILKSIVKIGIDFGEKKVNNILKTFTFGNVDTADVGAFFLGMDEDDDGVYHASFNGWQQYFGYNDLYDIAFDIGTSMETAKFDFKYNDEELRFWAWKGDYINLGSGAELGIYKRLEVFGSETPHWLVDKDLALPMSLKLQEMDKDNKVKRTIIDYNPREENPQWWITGFNPKIKDIHASNLKASYTINFTDNEDMYDAFTKSRSYLTNRDKWSLDKDNKYLMTFTFEEE